MLRSLREARGLSSEGLARHAGVDPKTIRNWEGDRFSPRLPELQLVLTTLGATDAQSRQALELLRRPRAIARLRQGRSHAPGRGYSSPTLPALSAADEGGSDLPPNAHVPVTMGDLLRAMRARRGRMLEEVAAKVGVAPRTLSRWERGERSPNFQHLHTVCHALDASEEEMVTLTLGAAAVGSSPDSSTLEEIRAQLQAAQAYPCPPEKAALLELTYISLALRLQPLAWQDAAARELLSQVYAMLANYYYLHGQHDKVPAFAVRTLQLVQDWPMATEYTILALMRYLSVRKDPQENLKLLKQWLPRTKRLETRAWILGQQAGLLANLKMEREADKRSQQALAFGDAYGCEGWEGRHLMRASLLSQLKQHEQAIDLLTPITVPSGPDIPLTWAKVLLAKKDYEAAQRMVNKSFQRLETWSGNHANMAPHMQRQIDITQRALLRRWQV